MPRGSMRSSAQRSAAIRKSPRDAEGGHPTCRIPWGHGAHFPGRESRFRPKPPSGPTRVSIIRSGRSIACSPLRIGHAVFFVPGSKLAAATEFYTNKLGFRLTESVKQFGDFMRCGGSPDHHNLFLITIGEKAGVQSRRAFELNDFDEIMVGGKFMEGQGWQGQYQAGPPTSWAPNLFWYFKETRRAAPPNIFSDMDVFDDNWQPKIPRQEPGATRHWMMS